MQKAMAGIKLSVLFFFLFALGRCGSGAAEPSGAADTVRQAAQTVMQAHDIPGMAIAVTAGGKRYYYNYGVASTETRQPVTKQTVFEIGSVSKTFAAVLASYAEVSGKLSLSDPASKFLPELRGGAFDDIRLLHLATHTTGGLTLQMPENVADTRQLLRYLKTWQPLYQAGTYRTYSNQGIGLLGLAAARSMQRPYDELLEKGLLGKLRLTSTFVKVSANRMAD